MCAGSVWPEAGGQLCVRRGLSWPVVLIRLLSGRLRRKSRGQVPRSTLDEGPEIRVSKVSPCTFVQHLTTCVTFVQTCNDSSSRMRQKTRVLACRKIQMLPVSDLEYSHWLQKKWHCESVLFQHLAYLVFPTSQEKINSRNAQLQFHLPRRQICRSHQTCAISRDCAELMTAPGTRNYNATHQLLYATIAEIVRRTWS